MKHHSYEYVESQKAFRFNPIRENSLQRLEEFFSAYQKIQNVVSLKLPIGYHFRVAKISNIEMRGNELFVKFYYDGLYGNKLQITYGQQQFARFLVSEDKYIDKSKIDVLGIKSVFQSLIETFHWSANFGLFLDPQIENLLYKETETDFYVYIPSFTYIAQSLADQKEKEPSLKVFDEFRNQAYQNLTFIFLLRLLNWFFDLIKQQDEDINLYKKIREKFTFNQSLESIDPLSLTESCYGVDFLYAEDLVKKKMIRYGLKQTQFLYQLNQNEILRTMILKFLENELLLIPIRNKPLQDESTEISEFKIQMEEPQLISTRYKLTQNTLKFFNDLKAIKPIQGISLDIYTPFLSALAKKLNGVQIAVRRNWKKITTKHELDVLHNQKGQEQNQQQNQNSQIRTAASLQIQDQQSKSVPNQQGHDQQIRTAPNSSNQDQNNSEIFEIKWASWINPQNLIYMAITQSGVLTEKDVKKFIIQYKIELLEEKNCYLVKTSIPEVVFNIDTADDIAYFVNSIQKERMPTNVYVDDTRKLTFYTALVLGSQGPILWEILKIMDIHQIYFYHCLDFYAKNISSGKQIKDAKYSNFLLELKNLIKDYEYDLKQIYPKLKSNSQDREGF
ncbi:unnamed protein product [Paramecium octaurelia]|uniref:Uncharacterized protein n=1 Tax=Paramecium octaurelia TaxID=43137 RepID=A0A8S1U041_PAROT|nr:unnamed protein product [Paramecium octaurelia]